MRNALPWLIALLAVGALAWFGLGPGAGPLPGMVAAPAVEPEAAVDAVDIAAEGGELKRLRIAPPKPAKPAAAPAADTGASGSAASDPEGLLDDLAALEELAAAGDPVAACRVAGILEGCRLTRRTGSFNAQARIDHLRQLVRTTTNAAHRDTFEQMLDQEVERLQRQQDCSEVGEELLALQPYIDLRAARVGDPLAAHRFVSGRSIAVGELLSDPALGEVYRQHAWHLFEGMLERGDQTAATLWHEAVKRRTDTLLWTVLPEEWRRPELAQGLLRRTFRGALTDQAIPLDPLGPAVEKEAEAMFQRYFAGKTVVRPPPDFFHPAHCDDLAPAAPDGEPR